jgi:putative membrane protein
MRQRTNSTLGISPTTADFVKEAATSDMLEIAAAKIAEEQDRGRERQHGREESSRRR